MTPQGKPRICGWALVRAMDPFAEPLNETFRETLYLWSGEAKGAA